MTGVVDTGIREGLPSQKNNPFEQTDGRYYYYRLLSLTLTFTLTLALTLILIPTETRFIRQKPQRTIFGCI